MPLYGHYYQSGSIIVSRLIFDDYLFWKSYLANKILESFGIIQFSYIIIDFLNSGCSKLILSTFEIISETALNKYYERTKQENVIIRLN